MLPGQPPAARPDTFFDGLALSARLSLHAPIGMVSLITGGEQLMIGAAGLPEPWQAERSMPATHSFCLEVVESEKPFLVSNSHDDPRLADKAAVTELGVIAYAGFPMATRDGVVGAVCAIDHLPRRWVDDEVGVLAVLAAAAGRELEGGT